MNVKQVAAMIVVGLVAGVVLGSFGVAGAANPQLPAAASCPPGMECGDATAMECGDAAAMECGQAGAMDCAAPAADAQAPAACADCE